MYISYLAGGCYDSTGRCHAAESCPGRAYQHTAHISHATQPNNQTTKQRNTTGSSSDLGKKKHSPPIIENEGQVVYSSADEAIATTTTTTTTTTMTCCLLRSAYHKKLSHAPPRSGQPPSCRVHLRRTASQKIQSRDKSPPSFAPLQAFSL